MLAEVRDHLPPVTTTGLLGGGAAVLAALLIAGFAVPVLLLAIVVPTAWACYRRPQRGVLIFVAAVPFHGLLLIAGLPSWVFGWKEYMAGALLVLTFVCPTAARALSGRKLPAWAWAVAGSLALGAASAAWVGGTQALVGLKVTYYGLVMAIVVWRCPPNARERDQLVTVFMVCGFVTAIVGLWQQVVGHAYLAQLGYKYNEVIRFVSGLRVRSFSTFLQPFPFAFYLMVVILIGLPASIAEPSRLRSKLFFLSLPVLAAGLLFSYVRAGFLGLILGLGYLAFHRYKILVYAIPFAFLALLFLPGGTFHDAVFESRTLHERTSSWSQRINRVEQHPLGEGIGSTGAAAEKTARLQQQNLDTTYQPDNSYLKTTFELGVFGLWLQLLMLGAAFLEGRAVEQRVGGRDVNLASGVCAVVLATVAASTVATYFEMIPSDVLFWILITVMSAMRWQTDTNLADDEELEPVTAGL